MRTVDNSEITLFKTNLQHNVRIGQRKISYVGKPAKEVPSFQAS